MKLVELLARELSEWPVVDGVEPNYIVQEGDKELYSTTVLPIYRGSTTWHRAPEDRGDECGYFDVITADLAEDWSVAIVTRTDWSAERARTAKPAKKTDKDGWIRHRGGKCPVASGTIVDVRYRDGQINIAVPALTGARGSLDRSAVNWSHSNSSANIMAYRLHKLAEQVEACSKPDPRDSAKRDSDYVCWMRDRITEIDATTQALTTERANLVKKLASEGFALIGRINDLLTDAAQKHEDMSDWRNWKAGDFLECVTVPVDHKGYYSTGNAYELAVNDISDDQYPVSVMSERGITLWCRSDCFKFSHRDPSA